MTSPQVNSGLPSERRDPRDALKPLTTTPPSRMSAVSQAILAPFTHKKTDSTRILAELAPVLMTPKVMNAASTNSSRPQQIESSTTNLPKFDFGTLGRAPMRLGMSTRRVTSQDLHIIESTGELLATEVPEPEGVASDVSLLRGFKATIPSSEKGKVRRRKMRNVEFEGGELGLKKLGSEARGLLEDSPMDPQGRRTNKGKRKARQSLGVLKTLGKEELAMQETEILLDKENIHVRRALVNSEISDINHKITSLKSIRQKLEQDLLKLHEEELELDDELLSIQERAVFEESQLEPSRGQSISPSAVHLRPSRRRKGPAFLPSEHDELPPGVAFMTLSSHTAPISALDFSEPYGLLVSAAQDDSTRVWDLCSGEEIGRLKGHSGMVKSIQVEDFMCVTGGVDGSVRIWDLRQVDEDDDLGSSRVLPSIPDMDEEDPPNGTIPYHDGSRPNAASSRSSIRVLDGHTKAVTTLYFEEDTLVTGASDKTIRQWDINTGQCVLTMDILWAISHPPTAPASTTFPGASLLSATSGSFAVPTPPFADGSWEMYQDFVGAVQFWGYALVSGSGDGGVRMWDMRTGQAHRTLLGHTAPVTCLQFDDLHIVSGSLDKTIRIWDLRTGGISETIRYDYPVTSLQFDTRKIIACTGENGIKVYNRTTLQHSTLLTNGHTRPLEKLRYMDRYLVSGARDSTLKIWAL